MTATQLRPVVFAAMLLVTPAWIPAQSVLEPMPDPIGDTPELEAVDDTDSYRYPQLTIDVEGFSGEKVRVLAISDDGQWLAAAAEKVVRVWNLRRGELHATLRGYQEPYGYSVGVVQALAFSPDSRFLAVGVRDNTRSGSTRLYDLARPDELHRLVEGHLGCTKVIAFSPDGRLVA
ncbi:MAG: hypothetical protein KDA75_15545, partial [Planctomycetaceae bacterium]|nr:hypothetical protein [Planctomycetaceae bacterium]